MLAHNLVGSELYKMVVWFEQGAGLGESTTIVALCDMDAEISYHLHIDIL